MKRLAAVALALFVGCSAQASVPQSPTTSTPSEWCSVECISPEAPAGFQEALGALSTTSLEVQP